MWSTPCARATARVASVEPSSITSHSTVSKPGTSLGRSASVTGSDSSSSRQGIWMISFMARDSTVPAISSPDGMTTLQRTDSEHLARAIELAEGGRGATSPNPLVGAVVVRDGQVLGEGFHARHGGPHAERAALATIDDARGATMYVSLEPCAHTGRTPPCTDAIIEAGIARVVIASDDPTEKAAGRGP